ncbi:FAD binding domain-containing protein [Cladophialophora immunda]|nr:FAD binding domain-containing protein [Cladophialophora immunda]
MVRDSPIEFIVIGAGYAGLTCAIELRRKGCEVHVIEREESLSKLGDVIMLTANATVVLEKWGPVIEDILATSSNPSHITIKDDKGVTLLEQPWRQSHNGHQNVWTNRGRTQKMMYEEAIRRGVKFTFGAKITKHWEDGNRAGVYVNDELITADAVIGADGVYSRTREYVTGDPDKPKRSGFAVYRSWFSLDNLLNDPLTHDLASSGKDRTMVWIGPDTHCILVINSKVRYMSAFITHKDTYTVEESWNYPGTTKDMLAIIEGWDPVLTAAISKIPEEVICDYKLLWRDPVMKWVSDQGRVVLVGDAAHPHLPTSGSGAAQAIEDGATLAAVVEKTRKVDLPAALKAFERLRFERTSLTQRMGWELRHRWHQTDWEHVKKNPDFLRLPQPDWLYGADAEAYGVQNYDAVMAQLHEGKPFKNTNLPPGHVHQDWNIETMMELDKQVGHERMYLVQ